MWVAACLTLCGEEVPNQLPTHLADQWGTPTFRDPYECASRMKAETEAVVGALHSHHAQR
jgi:hypothetical protein